MALQNITRDKYKQKDGRTVLATLNFMAHRVNIFLGFCLRWYFTVFGRRTRGLFKTPDDNYFPPQKQRTSLCDLLSVPPGKPTHNLTPSIISKHTYVCCHCQSKLPYLNLFLSAQNRHFKLPNRPNIYVQRFHIILWQLPGATMFFFPLVLCVNGMNDTLQYRWDTCHSPSSPPQPEAIILFGAKCFSFSLSKIKGRKVNATDIFCWMY